MESDTQPSEAIQSSDTVPGEEPPSKRRKLNSAEKKQLREEQRKQYWAKKREQEKDIRKQKRKQKIAEIKARGSFLCQLGDYFFQACKIMIIA
jgi:hypothetical protein